jgi:hypothetical protein
LDIFKHFDVWVVVRRRQQRRGQWIAGIAAVLLSACTSIPGSVTPDSPPEAKKDAVATRALGRWDALIKGDLDAAYNYLSPASRETMPLDVYKAKHKTGMYRAIQVDAVDCEAEVCTVTLSLTFDYKRTKGIKMPLVEKWLISGGKAWFVDRG